MIAQEPRASWARTAGIVLLVLAGFAALGAPVLAPNDPGTQFPDRAYAPPMRVHLRDAGGWHAPFVYRQVLQDRVMRQFGADRRNRTSLSWFREGRLLSVQSAGGPLLLLGADALGRDVFSRLLYGARESLGVAFLGALGALALGALAGALAGALGGRTESVAMLIADFVLVLPGVYLVLALRAALPPVLSAGAVFWLMSVLFAAAGWPHVARGVRAIVASERTRDYAEAARAAGAGHLRLVRQFVPAARGFLAVETVLLVPALLVAEATILVSRARVSRADAQLGRDAARRGQSRRHDAGALAARARGRAVRRGARDSTGRRRASGGERPARAGAALGPPRGPRR